MSRPDRSQNVPARDKKDKDLPFARHLKWYKTHLKYWTKRQQVVFSCFWSIIASICKPQIPKQPLPADKDHLIDGACAPYVITFLSAGLRNISRYPLGKLFYLSSVYSSASLCCCDMIMGWGGGVGGAAISPDFAYTSGFITVKNICWQNRR